MQEYIEQDAAMRTILENVDKGRYLKEHMIDEDLFQVDDNYYLLFITEEHIVYINIKEKSVIWEIDTSSLSSVEEDRDGIILILNNKEEAIMTIPEAKDIARAINMLNIVIEVKAYTKTC